MLYLTRKADQSVIINDEIEVKVIEIKGKTVKLGFEFPKTSTVLRKEVYDKVVEQNREAVGSSVDSDGNISIEDFFSTLIKEANSKKDSSEKVDD